MADWSRRGFLRLLGLGSAAAVIAKPLTIGDWARQDLSVVLPETAVVTAAPDVPVSLPWMTEAIADRVAGLLGARFAHSPAQAVGADLSHQYSIRLAYHDQQDRFLASAFKDQFLDPAGAALAHRCAQRPISKFGALALPTVLAEAAVVRHVETGVIVRGVRFFDPEAGLWDVPWKRDDRGREVIRFDVLVG